MIHQIWIGPNKPPEFMRTWKDLNPALEYILWDNEKVKELFPLANQRLYDLYETDSEVWNARSDILRYEILYRFGGIYLDADAVCLRPLEGEFLSEPFWAAYLNEKERPGRIASGVMGAVRGHPLMQKCVEGLGAYQEIMKPAHTYLGPTFFTQVIEKHGFKIKVLPSYYFFPHFLNDKGTSDYKGDFKPFADHLWGKTKKLYGKI